VPAGPALRHFFLNRTDFPDRPSPQTVGFTARKGVNWRQSGPEVAWG